MLDIHIANSFDAATRNEPVFGIELEIHAAFFGERSAFATDCPLLLRMSDYFNDCTFPNSELKGLAAEIEKVTTRVGTDSAHVIWLHQFHDACQEAIKSGKSLFVICD